ncbi:flagellar hook-length control protein FliK [Robinsoniella peoriensis]|uniref:flagellar hook-length control protein FliK n=1 Tax=Robinsoniella peoriensis TaxID=180332 RepID=UPI00085C28DA|nr:flagellar hook-length control protein FliK [Robinsoniella peoriensis]
MVFKVNMADFAAGGRTKKNQPEQVETFMDVFKKVSGAQKTKVKNEKPREPEKKKPEEVKKTKEQKNEKAEAGRDTKQEQAAETMQSEIKNPYGVCPPDSENRSSEQSSTGKEDGYHQAVAVNIVQKGKPGETEVFISGNEKKQVQQDMQIVTPKDKTDTGSLSDAVRVQDNPRINQAVYAQAGEKQAPQVSETQIAGADTGNRLETKKPDRTISGEAIRSTESGNQAREIMTAVSKEGEAAAGKEQNTQDFSGAGSNREDKAEINKAVKTEEKPGFQELQKRVDSSMYLDQSRVISKNLYGNTGIQKTLGNQQGTSLLNQVKSGIEQGIQKELQHFTIKLKPEGLGEIIVNMVSAGGKISMSIGVTNAETQKLLSSELANLKEALQPFNAQVQEIYHNGTGGMEFTNYQQGFYQQQNQMSGRNHYIRKDGSEEEDIYEVGSDMGLTPTYSGDTEMLNTYI